MRLDRYLFEKNLVQSRNKAKEFIDKGFVKVNGKVVKKASTKISDEDVVEIENENIYVSRAAEKLEKFLDEIDIKIEDRTVLDIGASTGGFTQILLKHGAKKVYSLDVGKDQLHPELKKDKRVVNLENTDIRDFFVDFKFDIVTCDVSFVSVRKILKDIDRLSKDKIIILFKPQFEVGKEAKRDKRGVVLDSRVVVKSMEDFEKETALLGWEILKKSESKIRGKEGNIEYFYYFSKDDNG